MSDWSCDFPNCTVYHAYGSNYRCGVSIIICGLPSMQSNQVYSDPEGRYLSVYISYGSLSVNIITVYAPVTPTKRKDFFTKNQSQVQVSQNMIISGNFYSVLDQQWTECLKLTLAFGRRILSTCRTILTLSIF